MILTQEDFNILVNYKGQMRESQRVRNMLKTVGLQFCAHCSSIQPEEKFPSGSRCRSCNNSRKGRRSKRRGGHVGDSRERNVERSRRVTERRMGVGMTFSQANYQTDSSEFYDEWNEIKGNPPTMELSQELYTARHIEKIAERQQRESA